MRAESVLIVGINRLTVSLLKMMQDLGPGQARVAGLFDIDGRSSGRRLSGHSVFGPSEHLTTILRTLSLHGVNVQRIILTVPTEELPPALPKEISAVAEERSIVAECMTRTMDRRYPASARSPLPIHGDTEDLRWLQFDQAEIDAILSRPYWTLKRMGDGLLAAVLLVILSPALVALALLVKFTLGSPIIFWQLRIGYYGRPFRLYKFRSMTDAFGKDGQLISDNQRLIAVGRFLRATLLDELPQLWNILVGEMSFVGPRPLLPIDQVSGATIRCLALPRLTGWAQVMGGRHVEAADKMALDIFYIRHASLHLDLEIMARTIPVILFGEHVRPEAIERAWNELKFDEPVAPAPSNDNEGEGRWSEWARTRSRQ
jgi:lipopolysaccharide/colanic/teichoic acid biosynthesis glycosyltransferase